MRERWQREAATRPDSSAKKGESLGRAEAWSKSLVSNGIQFCLMHGVQWSTREPVQTVVETPTYLAIANKLFSEEERADIVALVAADPECGDLIRGDRRISKGPGSTQGNGKKWRGTGCVYLARREIPGFSDHSFSEE
jgi:hypothetical protein